MDAIVPQTRRDAQRSYHASQDQKLVACEDDIARKTGAVDAVPSLQVAARCICSSIIFVRHGDYFHNNLSDTLQTGGDSPSPSRREILEG